MQYICSVCGYIYDEAAGIPDAGIAPGTGFSDLPASWVCPLCKADKSAFHPKQEQKAFADTLKAPEFEENLSSMEMSAICSNLARGCEKQYMKKEEAAFRELAEFFRKNAEPEKEPQSLTDYLKDDLEIAYPYAYQACASDRGALRSLVWSEKVTRMLQSLLTRYQNKDPEDNVYVCSVCGFIYVGKEPPELCPVCKVPSWKFEKVERRA